jgi:catechol 2,3-dioxygenase-like lactoylglutathione lyase family enzyme
MRVDGVLETCLYAADLTAAERFYRDVIGLDPFARVDGRHVFFRCGRGMLLVFDPAATSRTAGTVGGVSVPVHGAHGPGHVAFAVDESSLDAWRTHLGEHEIPIEAEIAWPRGGRSLYVRDPAGNSVELATPSIWGIAGA